MALKFDLDNLRGGLLKDRALILYNFELNIYKGQVGLSSLMLRKGLTASSAMVPWEVEVEQK